MDCISCTNTFATATQNRSFSLISVLEDSKYYILTVDFLKSRKKRCIQITFIMTIDFTWGNFENIAKLGSQNSTSKLSFHFWTFSSHLYTPPLPLPNIPKMSHPKNNTYNFSFKILWTQKRLKPLRCSARGTLFQNAKMKGPKISQKTKTISCHFYVLKKNTKAKLLLIVKSYVAKKKYPHPPSPLYWPPSPLCYFNNGIVYVQCTVEYNVY